jgi:type IV pilus biogenesis protein PilP
MEHSMKTAFYPIALAALFAGAIPAFAQDQVKLGDLLDLEGRLAVKKMTDELNKPNANAPASPPVSMPMPSRAPAIVYPTEAVAIYGTAPDYQAQLSMGGQIYTVQKGTWVHEYVVSSITPQGILLTKNASAPTGGRGRRAHSQPSSMFAPLASR